MRGEHGTDVQVTITNTGSSPHARGTQCIDHGGLVLVRFIPACAGNTGHLHCCRRPGAVHPRMRGEHWTRGVLRVERPTVARVSVCKRHGGDPAMRQRSEPSRWSWLSLSSLPPVALGQHGCRRTLIDGATLSAKKVGPTGPKHIRQPRVCRQPARVPAGLERVRQEGKKLAPPRRTADCPPR